MFVALLMCINFKLSLHSILVHINFKVLLFRSNIEVGKSEEYKSSKKCSSLLDWK